MRRAAHRLASGFTSRFGERHGRRLKWDYYTPIYNSLVRPSSGKGGSQLVLAASARALARHACSLVSYMPPPVTGAGSGAGCRAGLQHRNRGAQPSPATSSNEKKARVTLRHAGYFVGFVVVGPPGFEPGTVRL